MIESKGYKITPIDGDLAVSRNAEIGRDVDIHGKARVAGSLKVEGFLDAPHIKGAAKGLFTSLEELNREFPDPRPGWFAIVLDATDKTKGVLYKAENKAWVATTNEAKPYEFIADSINVFASKGELGDLENKVNVNADDIYHLKHGMDFRQEDEVVELMLYQRGGNSSIPLALLSSASESLAGVMSAEDKRNLNNSTVKVITWNNDTDPSNMNDFTEAGVYEIKGDRTRVNDNLPILNTGGGHSFNARLTVLDSSISGSGKDDDKCITQVLSFSNRLGQGEVYIRTGKGSSLDNLTWDKWSTLQRNVNVGSLNSKGDLRNYIDNGIYSGVFRYGSSNNDLRTFVMVVINDYAIGLSPRRVSQFLYSIDKATGKVSYETQTCEDETWKGWEILNKGEIDSMISVAVDNAIKGIIADAPEAFDTLKEIADWIADDETGAVALANAISKNSKSIADEQNRAESIEEQLRDDIEVVKNQVVAIDGINVAYQSDDIDIEFDTLGERIGNVTINAATTSTAGVMSAKDKKELDNMPNTYATKEALEAEVQRATEQEKQINSAVTELADIIVNTKRDIDNETQRAEAAEKTLEEAIAEEKKRLLNGDTIVGQAREIHSRNGKTVEASFLARTTAGSGTVGDGVATLKSVGGNIVKNLVDGRWGGNWIAGANTSFTIEDCVVRVTMKGTASLIQIQCNLEKVLGHKYYGSIFVKTNSTIGFSLSSLYRNNVTYTGQGEWVHLSVHGEHTNEIYNKMIVRSEDASDFYAAKPLLINLTEMFGAGKEPSKEECDKLFGTMDALPQGLTIANPTTFKSTGFNQFNPDNVLEGKAIVGNAIVSGDKTIAVIPCLPCKVGVGENNGYCIHGEFGNDIKVYLTPLNPMEVNGELYMHELTKDATTDTYVPLIKGYLLVEVPTTANLCAHFLWSEDKCDRDSYEPYFESKIELPAIPQMSEWGLTGIQSSGTLVCDEIDFERGVYVKRIGSVDLGSLKWGSQATNFYSYDIKTLIKPPTQGNVGNAVNYKLTITKAITSSEKLLESKEYKIFSDGVIYVNNMDYADVATLKSSLQGVMLYYELATPEEYPLPKVDNNYISSDYGAEMFDSVVPCNANNLYYMRSLAGETRNFLDRLMAGLGTSDATVVADRIIAVVNPAVEPVNVEPVNVEPETPIE